MCISNLAVWICDCGAGVTDCFCKRWGNKSFRLCGPYSFCCTAHLCCCGLKPTVGNARTHAHWCVPRTLLQKQTADWIWPVGRGLLTPALGPTVHCRDLWFKLTCNSSRDILKSHLCSYQFLHRNTQIKYCSDSLYSYFWTILREKAEGIGPRIGARAR